MSLADEVRAKEEIASAGKNLEKLMEDATQALAEKANSLAVSALDDGRSWHAGLSHIFENPEFLCILDFFKSIFFNAKHFCAVIDKFSFILVCLLCFNKISFVVFEITA